MPKHRNGVSSGDSKADLIVHLSRRERQILSVLYRRGSATAAEVRCELPEPPTYSAVRALLRILEEKGYLQHEQSGIRYVFTPTVPSEAARTVILKDLVATFFGGSVEQAVRELAALRICGD